LKKILNDEIKNVEKGEKLLVVSHSRLMRALFSTGVVEGKPAGFGFKNARWIRNAQIVNVQVDHVEKEEE
jgi:phosphohistidine phosphatase SixA